MERRPPRCFVVVRTAATLAGDRATDFKVQGFDGSTAEANPLEEGDKIAVYTGRPVSGFVATVEISGPRFFSEQRIWEHPKAPSEVFPIRYPATPRVVVPDSNALQFRDVLHDLEFSRNLINQERWGSLFIRAIRSITEADFDLIERELGRRANT
jgi:hypothetical protein